MVTSSNRALVAAAITNATNQSRDMRYIALDYEHVLFQSIVYVNLMQKKLTRS